MFIRSVPTYGLVALSYKTFTGTEMIETVMI